jgi:hypothetical protein
VILLCVIALTGSSARVLRGVGNGKPDQGHGNDQRGPKFDFTDDGGADNFLAKMDQAKLDRILENSNSNALRGKLGKMLDEDPDMGIDTENEALIFQCEGLAVPENSPEVTSGVGAGQIDPDAANAFNLASRPTATKKIWLDFIGGNITGTAWNAAKNLSTIFIPPYDKDGNPSSYSTVEMSDIVAVWRAVAEDFAPWNVDVTTIKPASLSGSMRVSIGGNGSWYGSAGGVAYVGVFGRTDTYYQPAFVFPVNLGPNHPKYVWEAASHEVGHTMGLSHDGVTGGAAYYQGQGDWAPIMGVGYYKPLSQWSKGEYTGANQPQDDVALITGKLGVVPAGNGDNFANATALVPSVSGSNATANASGIVSVAGKSDFFKFQASAGTLRVSAQVTAPWSSQNRANIDLQLTVYDAAGAPVATVNPPSASVSNGLGVAAQDVTLATAGMYYIGVTGAGALDAATTGYSNYGSLGQFGLTVSYPVYVEPQPSPSPPPPSPSPPPPSPSPPPPSPSPPPPSPSPPPPSPSPPPPSPSPPPVQFGIKNTTMVVARSGSRNYVCRVTVTLATSAGTPVTGNGTITYTWSSLKTTFAPYNTTTPYSSPSFTLSSKTIPNTVGNGCTFSVRNVVNSLLVWDNISVTRNSTW